MHDDDCDFVGKGYGSIDESRKYVDPATLADIPPILDPELFTLRDNIESANPEDPVKMKSLNHPKSVERPY